MKNLGTETENNENIPSFCLQSLPDNAAKVAWNHADNADTNLFCEAAGLKQKAGGVWKQVENAAVMMRCLKAGYRYRMMMIPKENSHIMLQGIL